MTEQTHIENNMQDLKFFIYFVILFDIIIICLISEQFNSTKHSNLDDKHATFKYNVKYIYIIFHNTFYFVFYLFIFLFLYIIFIA